MSNDKEDLLNLIQQSGSILLDMMKGTDDNATLLHYMQWSDSLSNIAQQVQILDDVNFKTELGLNGEDQPDHDLEMIQADLEQSGAVVNSIETVDS